MVVLTMESQALRLHGLERHAWPVVGCIVFGLLWPAVVFFGAAMAATELAAAVRRRLR